MTTKETGDKFELSVLSALQALGYAVERDVDVVGSQVDIIARKGLDFEQRTYVIECKDFSSPIGIEKVRGFKSIVEAAQRNFPGCAGMFISSRGFTRNARTFAESVGLILKTIDDLKRVTFNSQELAEATLREFSEIEASRIYVDLSCQTGEFKAGTVYKPVEKFLHKFLSTTKRSGCAILGDFGSGKTSLCYNFAAKLASQWLRTPDYGFLPVVIRLRHLSDFSKFKAKVLEEINEKLSEEISMLSFDRAINSINFLFILDGLDEIATRWDQESLVVNIAHLKKFMDNCTGSRFIITCRTHFFRTRIDEQLLGGLVRLYVRSWGVEELNAYVNKSNPRSVDQTLEQIRSTYNLEELSKTPIFLKMITETIGEFEGQVDHAQLYRVYTDKWINEQMSRSSMSSSEKRALMEAIALHMMTSGNLTVSHDIDLPSLISKHFGLKDFALVRKLDQDVRTCSFLVRDEHGDYFFVHKSYMEYFVGSVIAKEIQNDNLERLKARDFGVEVGGFVACFFKNDWRSIALILRRAGDINTQLNSLSIAASLYPNDKFESIVVATLHGEENTVVRVRVLECLATWATERSVETLVEVALDVNDQARTRAVTLLFPFMDRKDVASELGSLMRNKKFDPICADVIEGACELRTAQLHDDISRFIQESFWRKDQKTVFAVLNYIQKSPTEELVSASDGILREALALSERNAKLAATAIFFKVRARISREIQELKEKGDVHRRIEGRIRDKYGLILDDQDVGALISRKGGADTKRTARNKPVRRGGS